MYCLTYTSFGPIYSPCLTQIFGHWNSCGKIMGLAPWYNYTWNTTSTTSPATKKKQQQQAQQAQQLLEQRQLQPTKIDKDRRTIKVKLYSEKTNELFQYN
jgi:predicted NodU family carbamoyl transferase